jgi:hypothetical protein
MRGMRIGPFLFRTGAWTVAAALAMAATDASAAVYKCTNPAGKITIQGTPCPVVNEAPVAAPPAKPTCELDAEQRKAAVRRERQFLTRHADETAHRGKQLDDLKPIVERIRRTRHRYDELAAQRAPLDKEAAFYVAKPMPAWLRSKLDASDAQFSALVDLFRGSEQELAEVQARYQCERETFGKLWAGAGPGSSACDRPACAPP